MAVRYTTEEHFDMLETYFEAHRNSNAATEIYENKYPERHQPNARHFRDLLLNLLNYGSFGKPRNRKYDVENQERTDAVLQYTNNNPTASVRKIGNETDIPKSSAHRILALNKYHPYKPIIVQGLSPNDFPRRIRFSEWYLEKLRENPNFCLKIIWMDETRLTNCGVFNIHHTHYWSIENPHLTSQRGFQTKFGFNVWCGIIGNQLIGPFIFNYNLNAARYLELLQEQIMPAIRAAVGDLDEIWFMHDGCPAHNAAIVKNYLEEIFPNRLIANNGDILWPARSPDINPLDFFLWGHIKNEVYAFEAPENVEILEERVRNAFASLNRNTLMRAINSGQNRCQMVCDQGGGHIEQFL